MTPTILPLIRQAVQGERNDERFYDYLIRHAPDEQDRQILTDEIKHGIRYNWLYAKNKK